MSRHRSAVAACAAAVLLMSVGSVAMAQSDAKASAPVRSIGDWNTKDKLAIAGYDPVAYFPEGGGKAVKGDKKFEHEHGGVKYRFASAEHLAKFKANPTRYEPAHGGWCSYAMLDGEKVEVDPKSFIVKDDRLFLFYNGFLADTKAKWSKGDHAVNAAKADENWKKLSGESPRREAEGAGGGEQSAGELQTKLDEFWKKASASAPPERIKAYEAGIQQISQSGVGERAMNVGAMAPDFTLPDAEGKMVSLASMLKDGPVVLTWYRGGWCPFCNLQLRAYQSRMTDMQALGAKLVAVSPQLPDSTRETMKADELSFAVLSDVGNGVAKQYGITFAQPEGAKMDLTKYNGSGEGSSELPIPATYVIDRSGKIVYAWTNPDYRRRAEPEAVLAALRSIR